MANPKTNAENLLFVFLESKLYDRRVQKRFEITKKILNKNNVRFVSYVSREAVKPAQAGEILALTGFTSFYAGILEGLDPSAIPYVDYFKAQLKKGR